MRAGCAENPSRGSRFPVLPVIAPDAYFGEFSDAAGLFRRFFYTKGANSKIWGEWGVPVGRGLRAPCAFYGLVCSGNRLRTPDASPRTRPSAMFVLFPFDTSRARCASLTKALLTISIYDIFSCLLSGKQHLRVCCHGKVAEAGARSSVG